MDRDRPPVAGDEDRPPGIRRFALTAPIEVPKHRSLDSIGEQEIPITYVPARNTIFLSFALGYAEVLGARHIYIGVNSVDYSGYPDCRPAFINAFEAMANLGTKAGVEAREKRENWFRIHTPLAHLSKAQIISRGLALGVDYGLTFSCYDPLPDGSPCQQCDACLLRAEGFRQVGHADPALTP